MEEISKQDILFLELRQKLQRGILFIRTDIAGVGTDVKIESREDSILNIQTPERIYQMMLPGVRLVDASCQRIPEITEHGSHIRLCVRFNQPLENASSVIGQLKVKETYSFLCQSCGCKVLQNRVFKRVLPLPNGNWNALVDDWCCHPDPFANRKLLPRDEDCLLGDTYILLTRDSGCEQTLTQHANSIFKDSQEQKLSGQRVSVTCRHCCTTLGEEITSEVLKLYITEILVEPSKDVKCDETSQSLVPEFNSTRLTRQQFLERTIASRLVELSSAQSIFRFSIQNPDGKAMILLWLLNTDTLVASFPDAVVSFVADDVRFEASHRCQAVGALKVLYFLCSDSKHKDTIDDWEKDISVHPLLLPQSSCEVLQTLLISSTSRLPPSVRYMNSYKVAYLGCDKYISITH
ncbi:E3 ubiquitin-protein ligase E3D isoform X1 [Triplophysa dalaica]|uniref:E3 ubiquitin-protein ligase E3D isoform X1 n=1 Tax=Triplophysa dalaica TaxID=1582913 RepID=UPI0024DFEB35|nr:E3 ubiquitin-protein ligase E3D isoform X1 [Triplophysa dalaica]